MNDRAKTKKQLIDELMEVRRRLSEMEAEKTESRQSETLVVAREQKLDFVLEGADLGFWDWDLTTGKALWAEQTFRMLGYEPNEVEPDLKNWKRLIHPDDWPKFSERLNLHMKGQLPTFEVDYRIRNKPGDWQWVQGRGKVIEFGADGKLVEANQAFLDLFGFTREEARDLNILTVYRNPTDRKRFQAKIERHGSLKDYEVKFQKKDGTKIDCLLTSTLRRDKEGNILGYQGIARDISERKMAEDAFLQTERVKAIADLAGGVAHNFNNLLQVVMGGIGLALIDLEMGNMSALRKTLVQVLETSKFGAETVRRLQSFAQVRADLQPSEKKIFDLSETVKQSVEMTKPWWKTLPEKEGLTVDLRLSLSDGCLVKGSESEMFEVLVNLVKNAAEALPRGGEIRIETSIQNDQAVLQVADTGVGIGAKNLKKVFQPFWSTKGVAAGTGMGLAVSHGIIRRNGGTITVQSEEGKGSVFTIRFPLAEKPQEVGAPQGEQLFHLRLKFLVVDDMEPIATLLGSMLTTHAQTVFSAASGEEALEIFRNNAIDVVICDLAMPGMNGWDVGKAIRTICQERGVAKTPFILLTGWGGQTLEEEKIIDSGVDAVLEKPLDNEKLMATIKEIVDTSLHSER